MFASTAFCMISLIALAFFGDPNNGIHTALVGQLVIFLGAIFTVYTGAPVADDFLKDKNSILGSAPRGGMLPNAVG